MGLYFSSGDLKQCKRQQHNAMKKTYLLAIEGKNRDRLIEAAKHDIRKYIKRERAKALPKSVDFWDFDCQCGATDVSATPIHVAEMFTAIDTVIAQGGDQFYVEVLSKQGHRTARPVAETSVSSNPGLDDNDFE
jgi:hypothetical protein